MQPQYYYHLKCLGADFVLSGSCHQCNVQMEDESPDTSFSGELCLTPRFGEVMKLCG